MVILKFRGIDNIDDVQRFRQKELLVTRAQAVPLGENEYFIADLIGLKAVSDEGEDLGEVADVLQSAANDVYVIRKKGEADNRTGFLRTQRRRGFKRTRHSQP